VPITNTYKPPNWAQTQKNTTKYLDPFPSLSGGGVTPGPGGFSPPKPPKPPMVAAAKPAGAVAPTATTTAAKPAPVATAPSYSFDADPILNQVAALSTMTDENARQATGKIQQQATIDYGNQALGTYYGGPDTGLAAAQNPNSVAAQIARSYGQNLGTLENQLNDQNLFYSGYRAKQLGDLAGQRERLDQGAASDLQKLLSGADQSLAATLAKSALERQAAEKAAADRALAAALAAGGTPTAPAAPPLSTNLNPGGNPITNQGGPGTGLGGETVADIAGTPNYPYPGQTPNALGDTSPNVFTPVTVGSSTSAEPKPGPGNIIPGQVWGTGSGPLDSGGIPHGSFPTPIVNGQPVLQPPDPISQALTPAPDTAGTTVEEITSEPGYPVLNPNVPDQIWTPVITGSSTQAEPHATAGNIDPDVAAELRDEGPSEPDPIAVLLAQLAAGQQAVNAPPVIVPGRGRAL
jgi:hypothetical protein